MAKNLLAKQEEVGWGGGEKVSKRVQREERGREKERDRRNRAGLLGSLSFSNKGAVPCRSVAVNYLL